MARPSSRHRSRSALEPNPYPLVIAHRGASSAVPEHTLPAYLSAIETGADGLECDVRLTRDGHLVCVHDRTVDRTSNGSGVVSELDLSGLQALDFQSWHDDVSPTDPDLPPDFSYLQGVAPDWVDVDGSAVLTLEALLGVVADAGRPLKMLIETKHPTRYGGQVEKELVRLLSKFGWAAESAEASHPITIMSFASVALRRIRLLAPAVPLVLLFPRETRARRDGSLPTGVYAAGPRIDVLRAQPDFVRRAHALGNQVYCWTVDRPEDVELVRRLGVDAIITNRPVAVRAQLGYH